MPKKTRKTQERRIPVLGIIVGGIGLLLVGLLIYAIWDSQRPAPTLGESIPIASREHIPFGQKSVDYNSDPPTSGQHYDQPAAPGFYDIAPPDEQLVHSLEHGYVIIFFNCNSDADINCDNLTEQLRDAMSGEGISRFTRTAKLIVAPRPTMENLITYTSWGHLFKTDEFDLGTMRTYIDLYLDKSPEPNAS